MIRVVGVLSDLDDAEEAVTVSAQLPVNLRVDLECHGAALSTQLFVLLLQLRVQLGVLRAVETHIEDVPLLAVSRGLEVPVADDVSSRVAIAERVVRWHAASVHAQVHAKEGVLLVLSAAVGDRATHKGLNVGALTNRAGKGLNLADRVGVLPQAATAH